MKTLLKFEYLAFLFLGCLGFYMTGYSWWWFVGLFFVPDLSMVGYAVNSKVGAVSYNIFHSYVLAIVVYVCGYYSNSNEWMMVGSILFAHASFDRILGYGLKFSQGFHFTHLGKIGKEK